MLAFLQNEKGRSMTKLNYDGPAELFPSRRRKIGPGSIGYQRFGSAAEAIKFAVEVLPTELLLGTYLEVEEGRFDSEDIREFYDDSSYPLTRMAHS
jgi:hypothetical protein